MWPTRNDGSKRLFVVEQPGTHPDLQERQRCCRRRSSTSTRSCSAAASRACSRSPSTRTTRRTATSTSTTSTSSRARRHHDRALPASRPNPDVADPASAQILLVVPHPINANHNGGQLMFGPRRLPLRRARATAAAAATCRTTRRTSTSLLGKILRIDVDGSGRVPCGQSTPMPYAIPPSNPFVGDAGDCDEIWAYGLRNPWRYSFDRATATSSSATSARSSTKRSTSSPPRAPAARTTAGARWKASTATTRRPTATTGR